MLSFRDIDELSSVQGRRRHCLIFHACSGALSDHVDFVIYNSVAGLNSVFLYLKISCSSAPKIGSAFYLMRSGAV